jgi:iron complex outermembrane receptor protein
MEIKVYSASRYLQTPSDAAGTVTVVTRSEIQRYGYRTLADALRSVPGFYITYDRQYSYLGVRGFDNPGDYNTRILLMIDGHRLNDAVYEQAMLGTEFPVDIDLIERIEVIRGPAASIYGTNAVFGVINVITRKAASLAGFELSADAASFNSFQGRVGYGGTLHGIATVLSGTFYGSQGANRLFFPEYGSPADNHGVAEHVDDDQFTDLLATLSAHGFVLQSVYGRRNKADPTGAWDTVFDDPRNRSLDIHAFTDLKYDRNLSPTWSLSARTYFDRYDYHGFFTSLPGGAAAVVINQDNMSGEQWGMQVQVAKSWRGKHRLIAGAEYRDDFCQHMSNYDIAPLYSYQDINQPSWTMAEYLQGEFSVAKGVNLTLGLRHDQDPRIGNSFNPRISFVYHPWATGALKLTYGTAFRSPNVYELYYAGPGYLPPQHLAPERIRAWEGGFEQKITNAVSLGATFFRNHMTDFIDYMQISDGSLTFQNLPQMTSTGVEIALNAKFRNGILATASYSHQNAEDTATGARSIGSAADVAKGNLSGPLFHTGLIGGLEVLCLSSRPTLAGSYAPRYALVNATLLRKSIAGRADFSASIYNLLNMAIYDPGAQQHAEDLLRQDGRSFRVQLTLHFGAR